MPLTIPAPEHIPHTSSPRSLGRLLSQIRSVLNSEFSFVQQVGVWRTEVIPAAQTDALLHFQAVDGISTFVPCRPGYIVAMSATPYDFTPGVAGTVAIKTSVYDGDLGTVTDTEELVWEQGMTDCALTLKTPIPFRAATELYMRYTSSADLDPVTNSLFCFFMVRWEAAVGDIPPPGTLIARAGL